MTRLELDPETLRPVIEQAVADTISRLEATQAKNPQLRVLGLAENVGQHSALLEGFRVCQGEWIVTLDADLQNPPEEIPRILEALAAGHDVVGGFRVDRQDHLARRLLSRGANLMFRRATGLQIRDVGCMLRGYHRSVVDRICEIIHAFYGA